MPAAPNPLSALGAVSLAGKALKDFLARNEVRTLFRQVASDVRRSDLLPFGTANAVVERLDGLLVQPEIAGAVLKLLDSGDDSVREPLQQRFAQLLQFEAQGIDSERLAALVVSSIESNLARAKRTDREAMILETGRIRGQIGELKEQLADVGSVGPSEPLTVRSLQIAGAMFELPPSQTDTVQKLVAADPEGALPLQEALAAGGAGRVADAIDVVSSVATAGLSRGLRGSRSAGRVRRLTGPSAARVRTGCRPSWGVRSRPPARAREQCGGRARRSRSRAGVA